MLIVVCGKTFVGLVEILVTTGGTAVNSAKPCK